MTVRNTTLRYGSVAMTFHWIIAGLIVTNIVLGLWFGEFMGRGDPAKFMVVQFHKSIGLTVLVLSILRVIWRLMNPHPPIPWVHPALKTLALISHHTLYFLMLAIPLTGYVMVSASPLGNGTNFFGLFDWPNLPFFAGQTREQLKPVHELWGTAHVLLAWSSIALIPIHVGGALYHQFIEKDDVMRRMLPGTKVGA
jgi:cytochrome b561